MLIERIAHAKKHIVEVWDHPTAEWDFKEPFNEYTYESINEWCFKQFGYTTRTAYNRFEFKWEKDLTFFILNWG